MVIDFSATVNNVSGKTAMALSNALRFLEKNNNYHNEFDVIAVIKRGGKIISIGQNLMTKTHPVFFNGTYDRCIHAEYDAIRKMKPGKLKGADIYVFYFRKSGGLGNSKPCCDCLDIIREKELNRVYYWQHNKLICESV